MWTKFTWHLCRFGPVEFMCCRHHNLQSVMCIIEICWMLSAQATSGGGGWPMSVWLTPDLRPFIGGTYFPPRDSGRRTGLKTVLLRIIEQVGANIYVSYNLKYFTLLHIYIYIYIYIHTVACIQCSIGTKGPKVCQENIPHTLHHHHQPEPLRQGRINPCFHVLYAKFWPFHLNVAAEIETHQTRQHFYNLL